MILQQIQPLAFSFLGIIIFVIILWCLSTLTVLRNYTRSKQVAYECGFVGIEEAQHRFEIKYYLLALLLLIFDLELVFLFPYVVVALNLGMEGLFVCWVFVGFGYVAIIYEFWCGALSFK